MPEKMERMLAKREEIEDSHKKDEEGESASGSATNSSASNNTTELIV